MSFARTQWSLVLLLTACSSGGGGGEETTGTAGTAVPVTSSVGDTVVAATDTGETTSTTGATTSPTAPTTAPTSTGDPTTGASDPSGGGDSGFCQEACDVDADCKIAGVDDGYVCNDSRCQPGGKPDACNSDLSCQIVVASGLIFCDAPGDCSAGRVCVALAGFTQGACAPLSDGMGGGCIPTSEAATLPLLGGDEAEVCIVDDALIFCDEANGPAPFFKCNTTPDPCRSDADCTMIPSQPICSGGACVCTNDSHCADLAGLNTCVEGRCACTSDRDCAAFPGTDACVDGLCGCGSAASCPDATYHDGTKYVCEPL